MKTFTHMFLRIKLFITLATFVTLIKLARRIHSVIRIKHPITLLIHTIHIF